jgi:predicted RNA-binding protein with RPS1 domain
LSLIDPSDPTNPTEAFEDAVENQNTVASSSAGEALESAEQSTGQPEGDQSPPDDESRRRRILIGSQRDPVAYRARQHRDWTPVDEPAKKEKKKGKGEGGGRKAEGKQDSGQPVVGSGQASGEEKAKASVEEVRSAPPVAPRTPPAPVSIRPAKMPGTIEPPVAVAPADETPSGSFPPPNIRERLSADLEDELNRAMGDVSMDELMGGGSAADEPAFEPDSIQSGRVVGIRRDDVFVEFGGRQQGIVSFKQFDVPPQVGAVVQVVVQRFNAEDEMYELSVPNKAVQVDDWSDLVEGVTIEVRVTGHNTGGLECEVNHIRGFIPVSQIALYRVEDLAPYVDQRLACVITEANPDRRNLVLSRRAVLEREKEQAREQMLASLQPGQIFDGVVRKLMDFGAFVDIGGVDGLLHVSQLAWSRVKHPRDVLQEGQTIKVRVEKVDAETGKISLAYRDLMESPWATAAQKYPPHSAVRGTVTKLMEFGAFVELEPGIEGLVHISELSHKRVWRASEIVHEGDQVDVLVLSVDADAQRISLSIKALATPPEPAKNDEAAGEAAPAKPSKQRAKPTGPLLGGLSRPTGERFGLKW